MKNVRELTVNEIYIYKMDVIPFRSVITATNMEKIFSSFLFKESEMGEGESNIESITMKLGEFKNKNEVYPIDFLRIEPRRIVFSIKGSSEIAEQFSNGVFTLLAEIDKNGFFKESKPIFRTVQTSCSVDLDIDLIDLFTKKMGKFLTSLVQASSTMFDFKPKITAKSNSIVFELIYELPEELKNEKIAIRPKKFILEPRIGTPQKDKRYFISTPTDSATHFKLISEFENLYKAS